MPSSIKSEVLIFMNFFKVAILGGGKLPLTKLVIIFFVFSPETLITAIPEIPDPETRPHSVSCAAGKAGAPSG